ncbi:MAG TPA: alkaline phosphatase family protein, partial [Methanotrichaceae archaeon]|nr:alkaline phosphatase family protein [Methanotrichaceae archaeon]
RTPPIDGRPIDEVVGWGCDRVVLVIVDSLGYGLYKALEQNLPKIRSMAGGGLLLKAECVAPSTTPAIASILTGLMPHNHGISNTGEASESEIRSLLEWASSENVISAVVMEEEGARTFEGFVSMVEGVPKSLSVRDFDREILAHSLAALETDPRLLVAHFIGIDRIAHLGGGIDDVREAASAIDGHLGDLAAAIPRRTMMLVCGDHPLHAGELKGVFDSKHVALILWKKGKD